MLSRHVSFKTCHPHRVPHFSLSWLKHAHLTAPSSLLLPQLFRVAGAALLQRRAETDHDKLDVWHKNSGEPPVSMKEVRIYDDSCMFIA